MTSQTEKSAGLTLPLDDKKQDWLKCKIRDIPDFPKPGIIFKDLTTLFADAESFKFVLDSMAEHCRELKPDVIAGIEARGFIFRTDYRLSARSGFCTNA